MKVPFSVVSGPKFIKFWDSVGDPCSFRRRSPIAYVMFRYEELRHF